MPERRSVMECDGAMTDVASTYVLCLYFEFVPVLSKTDEELCI